MDDPTARREFKEFYKPKADALLDHYDNIKFTCANCRASMSSSFQFFEGTLSQSRYLIKEGEKQWKAVDDLPFFIRTQGFQPIRSAWLYGWNKEYEFTLKLSENGTAKRTVSVDFEGPYHHDFSGTMGDVRAPVYSPEYNQPYANLVDDDRFEFLAFYELEQDQTRMKILRIRDKSRSEHCVNQYTFDFESGICLGVTEFTEFESFCERALYYSSLFKTGFPLLMEVRRFRSGEENITVLFSHINIDPLPVEEFSVEQFGIETPINPVQKQWGNLIRFIIVPAVGIFTLIAIVFIYRHRRRSKK